LRLRGVTSFLVVGALAVTVLAYPARAAVLFKPRLLYGETLR